MNTLKGWLILVLVSGWVLAACTPSGPSPSVSTTAPIEAKTKAPTNGTRGKDPQNATYMIEGQPVTLVNGGAEKEAAPGSASRQITQYFGNAIDIDLNSDGLLDSAFLLTQSSGGSGTFFYVVAALEEDDGYLGTNAILLGDRIAPQSTNIDPDNPLQFTVNYADRKEGEPMSASPSVGVSKTFKLENGSLVEVAQTP